MHMTGQPWIKSRAATMAESSELYTVVLKSTLGAKAISTGHWIDSIVVTMAGDDAALTTFQGWIASQTELMELLNEVHATGHQIVALRAGTMLAPCAQGGEESSL